MEIFKKRKELEAEKARLERIIEANARTNLIKEQIVFITLVLLVLSVTYIIKLRRIRF